MPEVRAIASFYDMKDRRARNVGDEFFCEDDRAKQLSAYGMVEILGLPADEPAAEPFEAEASEPAEEPKPKPRKNSKKKESE